MNRLYAGIYALILVLFGLFCYLAHQFPYFPGDPAISLWLQGIGLRFFNPLMQAISFVTAFPSTIFLAALAAGGLWASHRKLEPIFTISLILSAALINYLLKLLISRPRPTNELVQILGDSSGFSFPSGHTTYAVVFFGFLFYLTPKLVKQYSKNAE